MQNATQSPPPPGPLRPLVVRRKDEAVTYALRLETDKHHLVLTDANGRRVKGVRALRTERIEAGLTLVTIEIYSLPPGHFMPGIGASPASLLLGELGDLFHEEGPGDLPGPLPDARPQPGIANCLQQPVSVVGDGVRPLEVQNGRIARNPNDGSAKKSGLVHQDKMRAKNGDRRKAFDVAFKFKAKKNIPKKIHVATHAKSVKSRRDDSKRRP